MAVRTKTEDREALRRNIGWYALAKIAGKEANRDLLTAGASYEVAGTFAGEVDGEPIQLSVDGDLQVGHDQTSSSTSLPDLPHTIALILAQVPKSRRAAILEELPAEFSATGELPEVEPDLLTVSQQLVSSLRSRRTMTKRGAVHFSRRV